ncbi:nucleotidyltransferase [bacterium]|nr:nucleotidyltransferase [bacterium]
MAEERIDPEAMHAAPFEVPEAEARAYAQALRALERAGVPFVVSGAHAMAKYTGRYRNTKDLDIFLEAKYVGAARRSLDATGFRTELPDPWWLAKAWRGSIYIDLIFAAGNHIAPVDEQWLAHSRPGRVFGVRTRLASAEDLVFFKAFICERHRFDGADIAHMIHGLEGKLDWTYLLGRMGEHWELLLWHLVFFRYVYPAHAAYVPRWLMVELLSREEALVTDAAKRSNEAAPFRGTLVSCFSFQGDVAKGYRNLREELRDRLPRPA